ncbi:MAG: RNA polymerase factor sigma-54 [Bacteroidota bacterium]
MGRLSPTIRIGIKTNISPQQIQFIKLLQVPTALLEARIKEELEVNPALDEGSTQLEAERQNNDEYSDIDRDDDDRLAGDDDFNIDDYIDRDSYSVREHIPTSDDEDDYEVPIVHLQSFIDRLQEQMGMLDLDENQTMIANHLIGSIDEDGYLRRPLPAVLGDMMFRYNIRSTVDELERILKMIQAFDPAGVGARNLQECLLLQLQRKESTEEIEMAIRVVRDYFDEFSKKHFKKLKSALGVTEERLKDIYGEITRLNPKPGGAPANAKHEYIIPDFTLRVIEGEIDIKLNSNNAPDLRVSGSYIKMYDQYKAQQKKAKTAKNKETLDFVKSKIESAQWFIDAIRQRQFTLLNTMMAIAERQKDFFISSGDEKKLRPMILKDIAETVGMDISTISRVANSKYVQTDWGIYSLKYFFTEGITTDDGTEVSNREVKSILQDLVDNENKRKPLSDDKLSEMLKEKGYSIARRTVAKYREQLQIPVARLRKEM